MVGSSFLKVSHDFWTRVALFHKCLLCTNGRSATLGWDCGRGDDGFIRSVNETSIRSSVKLLKYVLDSVSVQQSRFSVELELAVIYFMIKLEKKQTTKEEKPMSIVDDNLEGIASIYWRWTLRNTRIRLARMAVPTASTARCRWRRTWRCNFCKRHST